MNRARNCYCGRQYRSMKAIHVFDEFISEVRWYKNIIRLFMRQTTIFDLKAVYCSIRTSTSSCLVRSPPLATRDTFPSSCATGILLQLIDAGMSHCTSPARQQHARWEIRVPKAPPIYSGADIRDMG